MDAPLTTPYNTNLTAEGSKPGPPPFVRAPSKTAPATHQAAGKPHRSAVRRKDRGLTIGRGDEPNGSTSEGRGGARPFRLRHARVRPIILVVGRHVSDHHGRANPGRPGAPRLDPSGPSRGSAPAPQCGRLLGAACSHTVAAQWKPPLRVPSHRACPQTSRRCDGQPPRSWRRAQDRRDGPEVRSTLRRGEHCPRCLRGLCERQCWFWL